MNWNEGYYTDREYTYGYYRELNPYRCVLPMLHQGFTPPRFQKACELGFGQGVSLSVHAATSDIEWWGTDFMPSHAAFANELNHGLSRAPHVFDDSFSEFLERDLPGFDYIGLHGVLSWISPAARKDVFQFVRRRLNPGGVLYVSYNAHSGWGGLASVRRVLRQRFNRQPVSADFGARVSSAVAETLGFLKSSHAFQKLYPAAIEKLEELGRLNPSYLAHELLNEHWELFHFEDLANELEACKLQYCTSLHIPEHFDALYMTESQMEVLSGLDVRARESLREVFIGQTFRRDVWQRGAVSVLPRTKALERYLVHATNSLEGFSFELKGGLRKASLERKHYDPILLSLANQSTQSLAELVSRFGRTAIECLMVLQHFDLVGVSSSDEVVEPSNFARLNERLIEQGALGGQIRVLATSKGGGVTIDHVGLVYLYLLGRGVARSDLASATHQFLVKHGFSLRDEAGKPVLDRDASISECARRAGNFFQHWPARLGLLGLDELLQ